MNLPVYSQQGKKTTKTVEVQDELFDNKVNQQLLSQYTYVYLSNQRAPIAHTKDRSDVRGGGRKPHRQKGTGRARAGSIRSPIWRGGGVTFGPSNLRNWKKKMTKKMRRKAMASALSKLQADAKIKVIDKVEFKPEQLTKQAMDMTKSFGEPRKFMIVAAEVDHNLQKAFSNMSNAKVVMVNELNVYDLLTAGEVWFLQDALAYAENWIV